MAAVDIEPSVDRTRTWGIVLMSLLSAVLTFVLLKTRVPESPRPPEASRQDSGQEAAPPEPTQGAPDSPTPRGNYYRGWPLFEGWPLPQPPPSGDTAPTPPPPPPQPH